MHLKVLLIFMHPTVEYHEHVHLSSYAYVVYLIHCKLYSLLWAMIGLVQLLMLGMTLER